MNHNRPGGRPHQPDAYALKAGAITIATEVEPELYAGFAQWLDRDLARLETLYKDWSTAGYAQWRRSIVVGR